MHLTYIGHASILVECENGLRILTDPWLTQRLDRFWEHYPAISEEQVPTDVDVVLLSHHHYDHFHLPSLFCLNRDAIVLHPATQGQRAVTGPGGGAFAVPWLLRRLGFERTKACLPFEQLDFGDVVVCCLPSDVNFPEMGFLIVEGATSVFLAGDSILDAATIQWFEHAGVRPDLSVVPVHSTAPDACFRNRNELDDVVQHRSIAIGNYQRYLRLFDGRPVISGAFGWRITPAPPNGEESCAWMNRRIFPLTVADSHATASTMNADIHVWGPSDRVEIHAGGRISGTGSFWDNLDRCRAIAQEYAIEDPSTPMPPFNPTGFGPAATAAERRDIIDFVESRLLDSVAATPFYMQAIERRMQTALRVSGACDLSWMIDFSTSDPVVRRSDAMCEDYISVAERAFVRLLRSDLPYGHSWGYWMGNSSILDAAFTDTRYYMRYAARLLQDPEAIATYGM